MRPQSLRALIFVALISGCAPWPQIGQPIAIPKTMTFKKVIIVPPQIDVAEIAAGGLAEKIDEWSDQARRNVLAAIEAELRSKSFQSSSLPGETLPDKLKTELADTRSLFDAVNSSILLHVYGPEPNRFEEKSLQFDYSLGSATSKLLIGEADAFLFVKATDQISSAGRKAMQTTAMLAAAAVGVILIPQMGATTVSGESARRPERHGRRQRILTCAGNRGRYSRLRAAGQGRIRSDAGAATV